MFVSFKALNSAPCLQGGLEGSGNDRVDNWRDSPRLEGVGCAFSD